MTSSRGHQGAHGAGQIIEQLNNQAEAAEQIQGSNKVDEEIQAAANVHSSELDAIFNNDNDSD
ncbi:hypothetical protein A8709_07160 [Paenibacillus pectinilyticus]|uniref:DUF4025 domain-containing protein n=1 Tax=Paenibacillus pectinilyticus TaxID=512399 RepID=A0A1C0ZTN1_9BACL|nr:hypothetical protein [Paenibacillus pectinilyticus]OCT11440.1 hypothetical protein A8709_07160 [Paenibacillus pectinilyticus]